MNVVPRPGAESTSIVPPWSEMMRSTMVRPRPLPWVLVVKPGTKSCSRSSAESPGPSSLTANHSDPPGLPAPRAPAPPAAGCSAPEATTTRTWPFVAAVASSPFWIRFKSAWRI